MTDRELLEAAARAAGIEYGWQYIYDDFEGATCEQWDWNPLLDDGDALRLAVKLGICFGPNFDGDAAVAFVRDGRNICETYGNDPYSATRRAIVRAAAEDALRHNAGGKPLSETKSD